MSRDFEIIFETKKDLFISKNILEKIYLKKDNKKIFGQIEEREKSLFVSLTYPNEIKEKDSIILDSKSEINFFNEVSFVAIKNGKHDSKGYAFSSPNSNLETPKDPIHVSKIFNMISNVF